jgi:hypothetical protein
MSGRLWRGAMEEFSREALAETLNLVALNIPAKLCT